MEFESVKRFDLLKVLKDHTKKHKSKPAQFITVDGGIKKRLEATQKRRRSTRLSIFDSIRNLSRSASPAPLSEAQLKMENRRQQLEKWKEEKEKKKKEAAAQKKKPFVVGVARAPVRYTPPPLPPLAMPSTSGRVTRSQTRNTQVSQQSKSLAPKNATINPQLNTTRIPYMNLVPLKPNKHKDVAFEPVLPKSKDVPQTINEVKQTRTRTQNKIIAESKVPGSKADTKIKAPATKPTVKVTSRFESSSSSETVIPPIRIVKPLEHSIQSSTDTDNSSEPLPSKSPRTRKSMHVADSPKISKPQPRKSTSSVTKTRKSTLIQLTPQCAVPKSESSSEERLRSPKADLQRTPEQIVEEAVRNSPCVTMSRGKDNARREMKKKLEEGLLDEDSSDIEDVDHFRRQLASEIERMTGLCDSWERLLDQTTLPDSIQECILMAVGQSRLLMSQKLRQFATLVERCARPEPGAALVTPADLHGFWDMVFMQVKNVDVRFKELEDMRARGWAEGAERAEQAPALRDKAQRGRRRARPPAQSRIKDMLAAARKAAKAQGSAPGPEKTFEAGFFSVRSPLRPAPPPAPRTPPTPSLLKAVLSSEAKKASASKNSASFAMLRASVLGKNVECDGLAFLPQTPPPIHNANATPGRSILKQCAAKTTKSAKKSIKVVLFDKSDTDIDTSFNGPQIPTEAVTEKVVNVDSGLSVELKEEKENSRRKSNRLTRQNALEKSPMKTRNTRSKQKELLSTLQTTLT